MENTATKKLRRLVLLLFVLCLNNHVVSARDDPSAKQELITKKSPIIKTLQLKEGDIVDCYDINKQPTLDHPLLKNHKVQTRPRSLPDGMTEFLSKNNNLSIFSEREVCPLGTVPIPRSRKDVLNSSFTTDIAYIGHYIRGQQRVFVNMKKPSHPKFNGGGGWMSFYNISLTTTSQSSGSFIMIHNVSPENMNLISAGWMDSPRNNYGYNGSRLYIYWTADGYKTSCYNNIGCIGFVQTDRFVHPTYPFNPTSSPGHIYGAEFLIFKDKITGDWWLVLSLGVPIYIGYWPKEMFPNLVEGATMVAWGGIAFAGVDGQSPPMGSGHLPEGDFDQNSFFKNITYIDETFSLKTPSKEEVDYFGGHSGCYGLKNNGICGNNFGYCFLYGGPGGNCGV